MRKGCEETDGHVSPRAIKHNTVDHLRSPEEMAAYLEATFEEANGDAAFIARALGHVARSKGMAKVATEAGRL